MNSRNLRVNFVLLGVCGEGPEDNSTVAACASQCDAWHAFRSSSAEQQYKKS